LSEFRRRQLALAAVASVGSVWRYEPLAGNTIRCPAHFGPQTSRFPAPRFRRTNPVTLLHPVGFPQQGKVFELSHMVQRMDQANREIMSFFDVSQLVGPYAAALAKIVQRPSQLFTPRAQDQSEEIGQWFAGVCFNGSMQARRLAGKYLLIRHGVEFAPERWQRQLRKI
jgi:hypothetical protein